MICIAENSGGKGGVSGGAGANGQASQVASGSFATGYGYPVLELETGMTATLTVQLTKDYDGSVPADFVDITSVVFKAVPSIRSYTKAITKQCTFTSDGIVSITFTPDDTNYNNGVWVAEYLCYQEDALVQTYKAYLCIRKGLVGSTSGDDTITAMDVRLAIMDISPEANQLIDDLEFSDMNIYHAIERCLNEWNETPPSLAVKYDMTTFPYKEHLIKGAVGLMLQEIAYRYTRNRMQYSASGLSLDTSDKGPSYIQLATQAKTEWKLFIDTKKTEQNMLECMGTISMPYFDSRGW